MSALSWLFVPGDSPRKMLRARDSGAHALIFDWEDAVAPAAKPAARTETSQVMAGRWPAECWIRVNALDSPWFEDDVAALPVGAIAGVMLPKACGTADLARLDAALLRAESAAGAAERSLQVVAIVTETAASVLALSELREPQPRLSGLLWGAEDLAADLGALANRHSDGSYRAPFLLARQLMLLAAAATGCPAIDAVYTDFKDSEGLALECGEARIDGFAAKAAIHPAQVPTINSCFAPTQPQRDWAERVIAALADGRGVAVVDGRMVDAPHLRQARRILGS